MAPLTLSASPPASHPKPHPTTSCPSCGTAVPIALPLSPSEAQSRISELESQVRLVNNKAAAAADKLADYEDEVLFLRAQQSRSASGLTSPPADAAASAHPPAGTASRLSSFSAFLPGRRKESGSSLPAPLPPPPLSPNFGSAPTPPYASTPHLPVRLPTSTTAPTAAATTDLTALLAHEHALRVAAESSLQSTHRELDDLTAALFSQANEMVATERRARRQLEDRVAVLEKRDQDKRRRLDRLEGAVRRVERVRGLVGSSPSA
jgi:hypothetical protein